MLPLQFIPLANNTHTVNVDKYRFGFQGQEADDELRGKGNSVNYKYRMHDAQIGRFFAEDPLAPYYPHNSPYAFSENRVVDAIELEGLEALIVTDYTSLDDFLKVVNVEYIYEQSIENAELNITLKLDYTYTKDGTSYKFEAILFGNGATEQEVKDVRATETSFDDAHLVLKYPGLLWYKSDGKKCI